MKKLRIPKNLTDLAYNSIKEYIVQGKLDGESRLTEEFLSKQLGISKSPIREALNRLETEGLIRIEPRRGAYLRTFSPKEIDDLYDLRELLEVHAIGSATLSARLLRDLRRSLERMREYLKNNDKARYIAEDAGFHALLASAAPNVRLRDVLQNLQNQIWLSRRESYDLSSSTACDFHEGIVKALEKGDRAKARSVMSRHSRTVRTRLLQHLETQNSELRSKSLAG